MRWWDYMLAKEPAYKKVHDEILKGIQVRFESRWGRARFLIWEFLEG